jgi:protein-tyrosine phosphatase
MTSLLFGVILLPCVIGCGSEEGSDTIPPVFGGLDSVALENGVYHLSWDSAVDDETEVAAITYQVFEAGKSGLDEYDLASPIASLAGNTFIDISDLDTSIFHYFLVRACDEAGNCSDIAIEQALRSMGLEGAPNCRDIGGYVSSNGEQVKWGMFYRSDDLVGLTDGDMVKFEMLSLNRIIDFRQDSEFERDGYDETYEGNESIYDMLPFSYGDPYILSVELPDQLGAELAWDVRLVDYPNWYVNILEQNKDEIKQVFERFADPVQYPLLIHCSQGKDRAGVVSALVLLLLNVPESTILEDYMLTCELVDIEAKMMRLEMGLKMLSDIVPEGVTADDWRPMLGCLENTMVNLIDHIEAKYGGVEGVLESIGIMQDRQEIVREILLADQ